MLRGHRLSRPETATAALSVAPELSTQPKEQVPIHESGSYIILPALLPAHETGPHHPAVEPDLAGHPRVLLRAVPARGDEEGCAAA